MSSYNQGYTCIECLHSYSAVDGDLDERICNECLYMEQKKQGKNKMSDFNTAVKKQEKIEDLKLQVNTLADENKQLAKHLIQNGYTQNEVDSIAKGFDDWSEDE